MSPFWIFRNLFKFFTFFNHIYRIFFSKMCAPINFYFFNNVHKNLRYEPVCLYDCMCVYAHSHKCVHTPHMHGVWRYMVVECMMMLNRAERYKNKWKKKKKKEHQVIYTIFNRRAHTRIVRMVWGFSIQDFVVMHLACVKQCDVLEYSECILLIALSYIFNRSHFIACV